MLVSPLRVQGLPSPQPEASGSNLRTLDELVRAPDCAGYVAVRTRDLATAVAVERHVVRRARAQGRLVAATDTSTVDSCWREIATRLGIRKLQSDPSDMARGLVAHAGNAVVVVVGRVVHGTWDEEVLAELMRAPGKLLLVHVNATDAEADRFAEDSVIRVQGDAIEEAEVWWSGIVEEGPVALQSRSLADLDRWWLAASHLSPPAGGPVLSPNARELLSRLLLARRSWPEAQLASLGPAAALEELVVAGCVTRERGYVVAVPGFEAPEPDHGTSAQVASALDRQFDRDPWALARASELYAAAGQVAHGEACLARALREVDGVLARRQMWTGWCEAIGELEEDSRRGGALRGAELALELDDVEIAVRLAQVASAGAHAPGHETSFLLGRAQLARGDLVAARVSLDRALLDAVREADRANILAHRAEVAYLAGDYDDAARHALSSIEQTDDASVRLHARNTLGKLLLAHSKWDEAEAHFASDEFDASRAGIEVAQLRARVNRAVALLSRRCADQARSMLESVLADAEKRRELRATAFALSNLAVLAIERHDYPEALALCERAIDARRRLGDKIGLARVIVNLAELRLRLGLLDEADQALAFGRQALSPSIPPAYAAVFSLVSGWILLSRGRTRESASALGSALGGIASWTDGARIGECHRLAARIALEDGDTRKAGLALRDAAQRSDSAYARAETALLEALLARAMGQDAMELAGRALTLAAESRDEDLMRECNLLLCELARAEQRLDVAQAFLRSAEQLRDQVAGALPDALRHSYLTRRDIQALASASSALGAAVESRCAQQPALQVVPSPAPSTKSASGTRFVGRHPSVLRLLASVRKVATSNAPVLILGESGTGKELIAEAVHAQSDRAAGPLVKVNCAALVETLLLSELFGHEKGSFTGAAGRRRGRFELADGGTLFLDEIGDISPKTQVALLRVLQDHTFERVGGTSSIRTDVRIVCATHRDLKAMVAAGTFREDLYYRLCGITLEVPPLRRRIEDVELIASHLLGAIARERREPARALSPEALDLLERHSWPGNVRELDNTLRASSLFAEGETISAQDVAEQLRASGHPPQSAPLRAVEDVLDADDEEVERMPARTGREADATRVAYEEIRSRGTSLSDLKRQIERDCIERALVETHGNITKAATLLGMKRPRLSQLVKQYGLLEEISEEL
ncbi:MAG: sigma 54-interacting transcriptional regulator [Deltaproteobacteria bacterium]|nr:sigma 54-interacting transcriptional regulator [Deltaproteobacteria bacterium]